MGIIKYITGKVNKICALASGATGGVAGNQFTQYIDDYVGRQNGFAEGVQYIGERDNKPHLVEEANEMREGLEQIVNGEGLDKIPAFVKNVDLTTAVNAFQDYTLSFDFSSDAAMYTAIGLGIGVAAYYTAKAATKRVGKGIYRMVR